MFMAPFTNLHFCGAATNRIKYSKENQPTKTASATAKKMCSSSRPSSCFRRVWQDAVKLALFWFMTWASATHPYLKHGKRREYEREGGCHYEEAGNDGEDLGGERRVWILEEIPQPLLQWADKQLRSLSSSLSLIINSSSIHLAAENDFPFNWTLKITSLSFVIPAVCPRSLRRRGSRSPLLASQPEVGACKCAPDMKSAAKL